MTERRYCLANYLPCWLGVNDATNVARLSALIEHMAARIRREGWLDRAEWTFQGPPPFAQPGTKWDEAWLVALEVDE